MSKILIIGGGELGQALSCLASGHSEVFIFDQDKSKSNTDLSLEKLTSQSEVIFLAIPSRSLDKVCHNIKKFVKPTALIVSLAKGMSDKAKFSLEVLQDNFTPAQIVLLNGPMIAEEILKGRKAFAVVAGQAQALPLLQEVLNKDYLSLQASDDLLGVSIMGVVKNIYTVGLSISSALNLGQNTYGALLTQAIVEMSKLNTFLGGKRETPISLAGLGDLTATSTSVNSRNRQVGQDLVTKGECCLDSEGTLALASFLTRVEKILVELPFLRSIKEVVINKEDPEYVFTNLVQKI